MNYLPTISSTVANIYIAPNSAYRNNAEVNNNNNNNNNNNGDNSIDITE